MISINPSAALFFLLPREKEEEKENDMSGRSSILSVTLIRVVL